MSERQTYYQILGLAPRYRVEPRELEERYHAQSKLFHPDRHVKADGPTREILAAEKLMARHGLEVPFSIQYGVAVRHPKPE